MMFARAFGADLSQYSDDAISREYWRRQRRMPQLTKAQIEEIKWRHQNGECARQYYREFGVYDFEDLYKVLQSETRLDRYRMNYANRENSIAHSKEPAMVGCVCDIGCERCEGTQRRLLACVFKDDGTRELTYLPCTPEGHAEARRLMRNNRRGSNEPEDSTATIKMYRV